jgi:hypothetical protein
MAKTVYTWRELLHMFANRACGGIDLRTSDGNLSTRNRGDVLLSYGQHYVIGAFLNAGHKSMPALLLWNDDNYSSTTCKHKHHAYYALPAYRRQEAVHVPSMELADLNTNETLSKLARACLDKSSDILVKWFKARGRKPAIALEARKYIESARSILRYVGDVKTADGLPALPSDATKEQIEFVQKTLGAARQLTHATEYIARLYDYADRATMYAASYCAALSPEYRSTAGGIFSVIRDGINVAARATDAFKMAGKPAPRKMTQTVKELNALMAEFEPLATAELQNERAIQYRTNIRNLMIAMRQAKRPGTMFKPIRRKFHYSLNYALNELAGMEIKPEHAHMVMRAKRAFAVDGLNEAMGVLDSEVTTIESEPDRYFPLSVTALSRAASTVNQLLVGGLTYWSERYTALMDRANLAQAECDKRMAVKHATTIAEWRAGKFVHLPSSMPTMMRIVGDVVETSRGASVPLTHAMRLVRIAERIAAKGGQDWERTDGPRVGHYTVNHIGPDMSAVIGCHTFSAEESARIVAALKAHPMWNTADVDAVSHA